jgi:hypothetical protein
LRIILCSQTPIFDEDLAKQTENQYNRPSSTEFFTDFKIATQNQVITEAWKGRPVQIVDLREATKILDAYSTSVVGKSRFYDQMLKLGGPGETEKITAEMIAKLESESKEARIILILIMEEIVRHSKQLVAGFCDELVEWYESMNRCQAAIAEAVKVTRAHAEKSRRKDRGESPSAKAIREFRAECYKPPN